MALAIEKSERGVASQNVTVQPEFDLSDIGRPEEMASDGLLAEAAPPCVALVPLVQSAQWSRAHILLPRPDPTFVTQLIATAEQMPQTRSLRRGTAADAQTAYAARRQNAQVCGLRARQVI
jgi:hypothetical protein